MSFCRKERMTKDLRHESRITHERVFTYIEEIRSVDPLSQFAVSFCLVHGVAGSTWQTRHGRASLA